MFFKHGFLLPSRVNLCLESLGLPHSGDSLCDGDCLYIPLDFVILMYVVTSALLFLPAVALGHPVEM